MGIIKRIELEMCMIDELNIDDMIFIMTEFGFMFIVGYLSMNWKMKKEKTKI